MSVPSAWGRLHFDAADARHWQRAGIDDPVQAAAWRTASIGPDEVDHWRSAGIGPGDAVAWRELGFSAKRAGVHKRAGRTPAQAQSRDSAMVAQAPQMRAGFQGAGQEMHTFVQRVQRGATSHQHLHSYLLRRWFDDEAAEWACAGIEAADAIAWKELGLSSSEAAKLARAEQSPMRTVRMWCEAGIPFDEIPVWLGAGLTPSEAAAQREKGIAADRAEVLRALRDDDAA